MTFLPLYVRRPEPPRILIIGGGYAGLAALITIRRHRPDADITLVDARTHHIKLPRVHETIRPAPGAVNVPLDSLAERFAFRHIRTSLTLTEEALQDLHDSRGVQIGGESIGFDAALIAAGSAAWGPGHGPRAFGLSEVIERGLGSLLESLVTRPDAVITVVGGGATGIQFLFEIANHARERAWNLGLRLVDGEDRVLSQFPADLSRYVATRMAERGIAYDARTFYRSTDGDRIRLTDRDSGRAIDRESHMTLVFPGQGPALTLTTTIFGQVMVGGRVLGSVFAAGDCAHFRGIGSNALTAQSAVRKGKLVARNMLRSTGRLKFLEPYVHRDLGYVISLGPHDAIGWLATEGNVVAGTPAVIVKQLVEAQYDLLLAGIDTYVI